MRRCWRASICCPADQRRTLQLGAVLGRSFAAPAIAALGGVPAASVAENCHALVERDLLRPAADSYVFRHILIREVAYQTLPRAERARLHAAAAAWLERGVAGREDALAELIAFHYREAVALAGASADADTRRRAVDWLSRAAEAAYAGAATVESLAHLRAAIELAEPSRLPDLYERLGATTQSGSAADGPLRTALRLSEEQQRPSEDQLRILARLLMFATRAQGSVASRMSDDEMAALRARGRALLAKVDPEGAAAARFLAADAFYPFWMTGRASDADVAAAERDAKRAAQIAERLGDTDLLSAALDAITGAFSSSGDYASGLAISRRRVSLGRRVNASERLDAYSMVTWACSAIGDLAGADAASAEGLAQVQPGQEPAWSLHLVAWRIYSLMLLGRWEAIGPLAQRARLLWEEMDRETAGYALRGFFAALEVAESRGEAALAANLREVVESILAEFKDGSQRRVGVRSRWLPLLHVDRDGMLATCNEWNALKSLPDSLERLTAALSDHAWSLPAEVTTLQLAWASSRGLLPLELQLRRAIGLRDSDPAELARALAIADSIGARSPAARLRFETARAAGDEAGKAAAIAALEAMGDHAQIRRFLG